MVRRPKSNESKAAQRTQAKRVGQRLKAIRSRQALSRQDLAKTLGVTPQYIYMIEAGRASPSEERIRQLAAALGDPGKDLLEVAEIIPSAAKQIVAKDPATYEQLLEDVDRFAEMLRERGLSEDEIQAAIKEVPKLVIQRVVAGKEPLDIDRGSRSRSRDDHWARMDAGEAVVSLIEEPNERTESPSDYLNRISGVYVSDSSTPYRPRSASKSRQANVVTAGHAARIVVDRPLKKHERQVLESLAAAIEHVLNP